MLTILSANENLLERLELLTQNTPRPIDAGPEKPARAHTVLLNGSAMAAKGLPVQLPKEVEDETIDDELEEPAAARSLQHRCCTKWMLLMAKKGFDEHQITLQTLADLFRLSLAMSGTVSNNNEDEPSMRILILKKERAEEDEEHLRAHMDAVRREWSEQWGSQQADKLRRFGESDARREQLDRTKQWMEHTEPGNLCCALAYFDDPNLMKTINKFFQLGDTGFDIVESADEECGDEKRQHQLFTKPPALHWTNYPREAEVQVTFKFTFPKGTVPEWLFRHWIRKGKQLMVWDYEYEWTNGILLRADELVKITITRAASEPHVLEVSGRIDTDEAAEEEDQEREDRSKEEADENDEVEVAEEEEGENATARVEEANGGDLPSPPDSSGHSAPLQKVWPYLVRIFQQIVADIENRKTLPFCLSLVFIGELFFKCPEGVQKLGARSLDAIQTLSSIQRIKAVRFRADQEQIFALDLDQCFPNFRPTRLADFSADKLPLPTPKLSVATSGSSSPSEVPTAATSLGGSAILVPTAGGLQSPKKARVDRSPSCVPAFALAHGDEARLSPTSSIRKQQNNNGNSSTGSPVDQPKQPSSPQLGAQSLHVERQLGGYKNRGRRVSFGVIHSIPSQGEPGHSGRSSPGGASSPLLMSISSSNRFSISPEPGQKQKQEQQQAENVENGTSDKNEEDAKKDENDEQENREQKHHRKQSAEDNGGESALVENIVDEMLQKAIDEVLVIAE